MKVAIVHIGDIHFKKTSDTGFKRREKLANTISFARSPDESLLFLVTGDITYSGSQTEYAVASEFFRPLLLTLGVQPAKHLSAIVFIPGNHDCNFREVGDLRPSLLDQIPNQLATLDASGEKVRALLQVQSDFFAFNTLITGENLSTKDQLFYTRVITFGEYKLELRCFNSAWLSRTNEQPGALGFPSETINAAATQTDSDVVISLVHHPYNWLNPVSYQSFRRAIQETSDFLFTGHEHTQGGQIVSSFAGGQLVHFESGPYQPPTSGQSEFSILHLDFDNNTWRREAFAWSEGSFTKAEDGEVQRLASKEHRSSSLRISGALLKRLSDPGTGFLHPRQQDLTLSDIYVFPDIKTRSISRRLRVGEDLPRDIPSPEVCAKILSAKRLVIAGPTDCGKTALSKMIFIEANVKHGRSCLLLCGKSIKGNNPAKGYKSAIDDAIDENYGPGNRGRYAEQSHDKRVLLIDDWDEISFNRAGRSVILREAIEHFGSVILFTDDIFLIEELSGRHEYSPLGDFQIADIREFGFRLRGQLVRKWHALGNAFIEDEQAFARNIADSTRVIDTVLGRNLLPSYPVNIITLLQTYDAGAGAQNGGLGSYGQVYEALITARLAKGSIKSIDIGTKITFLSRVAWFLFSTTRRCIDVAEWRESCHVYYEEYAIRVDSEKLLKSLVEAGILSGDDTGYCFSYGYTYCYFVAKYFQENLADLNEQNGRPELFERLKRLSERVYKQDNASIIIFYVFLTKDRSLIDHVIANARSIFKEHNEFDFDSQLGFVNSIVRPITAVSLPDTRPDVNQQAYDQRRDEAGEQIEPSGDPSLSDVVYDSRLPFEQKLIIGIRYLTLMGQILRNFPGSLKAETKLELAFESYSLGLRTLGAVFNLTQLGSDEIMRDISAVLRSKMAFSGNDKELRDRAELIVAELLREITFGLLKRLSHAIGLRELEGTYDEVANLLDKSLPCRLIHLSIRLDHFERFPKKDIEELAKELEKMFLPTRP
jgi:predicted MPP superfamily phosphohydrolase